ncbi:xanthine dehydrogenase accessory protein XdhC [Actibacterium ureilyticum]|uniref:xanthine dehydrogenase accessory protein XdhC n=1 Tax=Actibacterium ureilyticum TaxID=1590614 RepID=UPI000BAAE39C|nr:xanthine dehydrogenase accessory protein XdhC [Actibacterium ureilyticum]
MSFDLQELRRAVAAHGIVARVVVAATAGSVPREVGAAMLVWPGGQSGTIGGGALEYQAAGTARGWLSGAIAAPQARLGPTGAAASQMRPRRAGAPLARLTRHPLGPQLGQCCGGAVSLLTEFFDHAALPLPDDTAFARAVAADAPAAPPLKVARITAQARNGTAPARASLIDGWFVEPIRRPQRPVWIHGAGHVGRALVETLAPLPDLALTWTDISAARFPAPLPQGVTQLIAANPADLIPHAPSDAEHLILTYSHALDLELCHRVLSQGFGFCGLIGSATKWARFRNRLRQLGHADAQIARICCPIGQPSLGKHPQAIAIGVAATLLQQGKTTEAAKDARG